jgi:hypothetical protein
VERLALSTQNSEFAQQRSRQVVERRRGFEPCRLWLLDVQISPDRRPAFRDDGRAGHPANDRLLDRLDPEGMGRGVAAPGRACT